MKRKIMATALAGLVTAYAQASGYQVNTLGVKNNAMGHTGTGLALDQASIFFNPGALAQLRENGVQLGASAVISRTKFSEPTTFTIAEIEPNTSFPFHVYGSYGFMDNKLRAGIGVYTPFGSTVEYKDNWIGQFALNRLKLQTIFVQPTVSYAISDMVSVGAGLVYAFGGVNLQRSVPLTDSQGNYGRAELDGRASGFGYNLGVYVKPSDKISIGLSYRSKVNMEVSGGDVTFNVPASVASNFSATQFDASLPMPSSLNIGIGVMPTEKLTIAADVNFIGWSAYESLDFDYNGNAGGAGVTSSSSPRKYENSYALRLGTQYMATENLAVRLGAYYDKTPVQAGYMTAETPDSDRIGLTGGLGYKLGDRFNLDLSLIYIEGKERTQTADEVAAAGTQASTLAGTWKTKVLLPGLGVTVNF